MIKRKLLDFLNDEQGADQSKWKGVKEFAVDLVAALVIAFILFQCLFGLSVICGPSMNNTLHDGNIVFFRRIAYTPERGDIILAQCDALNEVIVKRIIGIPGDVIEIDADNAVVYRNGEPLDENYLGSPTTSCGDMTGPVTVDNNCVFVMGDNRENSSDSRFDTIGQVSYDDIIGVYIATILP